MNKVLVIGAGPIKIGHACEFDYSGTQVCNTLRKEGIFTILLNSNPATFMTSKGVADKIYIEGLTIENVLRILKEDQPDAIVAFAGGQVALNLVLALKKTYSIEGLSHGIKFLGTDIESIKNSEDRSIFHRLLQRSGIDCLNGFFIKKDTEIRNKNFPLILRTSYSLGGSSSCVVNSGEACLDACKNIWNNDSSAEIFAEEYVDGWAEYELEVVKDKTGECCVICCIENIDPMGIHTGDSITVSPPQTISKADFERMKDISYRVAQAINLEAGSFNVQFAKCHTTGSLVLIEVNARLSRSSALASKVMGIPIAVIATKLALGYQLSSLKKEFNFGEFDISTRYDSVAVKLPVFQFEKLNCKNRSLKTYMQSIGEVMGIGNNFKCALLKAVEGAYPDSHGLLSTLKLSDNKLHEMLSAKHYNRLFAIAELLRRGASVSSISSETKINEYFIREILDIIRTEKNVKNISLEMLKKNGFSDRYISKLLRISEKELFLRRHKLNINPGYRTIGRLKYFYSSYSDIPVKTVSSRKKSVLIIGSGPNKIGQGLEFDYCCVHASIAVQNNKFDSIIINCNPATVSTDYNMSTRLYFEPLSSEYVINVIKHENVEGVFLQFGGQDAIKLAKIMDELNVNILGTSYQSIDIAEEKSKFRNFLNVYSIPQPKNDIISNLEEAFYFVNTVGYPVILRPSYVIGGSRMSKINNKQELMNYFSDNAQCNILIEEFIENATEIDVDAICDGEKCNICGIMQQIESSGVHSGDSSCITPPYDLDKKILDELCFYTKKIGVGIGIKGLFNVQFIVKNGRVFVIEANPRASRTVPFVSKTFDINPVQECVDICLKNHKLSEKSEFHKNIFALKRPIFSKLPYSRDVRGVEMYSTGEEMFLCSSWKNLLEIYCN